jgi:3-oxoacyl-[acyl-carrier-protein] synthase-3
MLADAPAPLGATAVRPAGIAAIAMATPSRVVDNAAIAAHFEVQEEWIERRTGIVERRHAVAGESLVALAASAG